MRGRSLLAAALATLGLLGAGGCSVFGHSTPTHSISVFSVKVGDCFDTPGTVKQQLSSLSEIACTKPHTEEAYAVLPFQNPTGTTGDAYPGDDTLTTFAQGACAQAFGSYVGIDYLDSKLFFTYLLPSARSWEQDSDRTIICFITTTGNKLTSSVKGSKL